MGSYPTAWLFNLIPYHSPSLLRSIEQTFRFGNLDPAAVVVTMDLATTNMNKHLAALSSFGLLALTLVGSQPVRAQAPVVPKDSAPSFSYAPTDDTNNPALVAWQ